LPDFTDLIFLAVIAMNQTQSPKAPWRYTSQKILITLLFCILAIFNLPNCQLTRYLDGTSNWLASSGLYMHLSGMYSDRENSLEESRISIEGTNGAHTYLFGRQYRWIPSRNPLLITQARLAYYQTLPLGAILKQNFSQHLCKTYSTIFNAPTDRLEMQTRFITLEQILKAKNQDDFDAPWVTKWSYTCNEL
jgi:hypothetical protein